MSGFQRSQVAACLWEITHADDSRSEPTATFHVQIKKLLDLDRSIFLNKHLKGDNAELAFNDELAKGSGWRVPFSEFNVFMLAIALTLWNAGFKQAEIVSYLQLFRTKISNQHKKIRQAGGVVAPIYAQGPDSPLVANWVGPNVNDDPLARVYLLVNQIEFTEALQKTKGKRYFEPSFAWGVEELAKIIARRHSSERAAFLIELADIDARIRILLPNCTARLRHRSSHLRAPATTA